jgi:hypothetical protein
MKRNRFMEQIHHRSIFLVWIGSLSIPTGSAAAHHPAGLGYGCQLLLDEPAGRLLALDWL